MIVVVLVVVVVVMMIIIIDLLLFIFIIIIIINIINAPISYELINWLWNSIGHLINNIVLSALDFELRLQKYMNTMNASHWLT